MKTNYIITLALLAGISLPAMAQYDIIDSVAYKDQRVDVGATRTFSRENSAASVSVITNKDVNRRGARNIGNNLIGQGNGLVSLQGAGLYNAANPTFYVRGLQSLSGSTPLILVDGIERSIDNVIAEDVESVTVLKDAAATAIYGYKGANGAILITTKHGNFNERHIRFSYDHEFQLMTNKPKFVDAATYASAVNEAYRNQGGNPVYSDAVIQSYQNNSNPLYFPNVNWVDETFRDMAHMNRYNLEFSGGGKNIRYYTDVNLLTSYGFVKNTEPAEGGYSTQNKYTRATIRSNMDVELTPTTILHTHIFGVLTEQSQPGDQADLWSMVYQVPANAFPIRLDNGVWGGNSVYTTNNPYAQSNGTAYYKNHQRSLNADFVIDQDLSSVTEGLKASVQLGYDTWSNLYENHSKSFRYGSYSVTNFTGGVVDPAYASLSIEGNDSNMGTGSGNNDWTRRFFVIGNLTYDRSFGKNDLFGEFRYNYEFNDVTGTNTSLYRQNFSFLANYAYDKRYTAQVVLVYTGTNRLAKGSKWAFMPTGALSWNVSNEAFMEDVTWIDFLKLRASAGLQQLDVLPGDNVWTYFDQFYAFGSPAYSFDNTGSGTEFGNTYIAQARTQNLGREKALKYNAGLDATLFKGLDLSFDYYFQNRYDIWCSTSGSYTSVFGLTAPYENVGKVESHGFEVSLDYSKRIGDAWTVNIGGTYNVNKNEIKEQAEAPQLYPNTVTTGHPYTQTFGYIADGFFQTSDDANGNGIIEVSEMASPQSFTTVYPGDCMYADIGGKLDENGNPIPDGIVDGRDKMYDGYPDRPEYVFGSNWKFGWKGWSLSLNWIAATNVSRVWNADYRIPLTNSGHRGLLQMFAERSWIDNDNTWAP